MLRSKLAEKALMCPLCKGRIMWAGNAYHCQGCQAEFRFKDEKIFFEKHEDGTEESADDLVYRIKRYFKKNHPGFFFFLYNVVSFVVGKRSRAVVKTMPDSALIINVGSGVMRVDQRVINVDFMPEPGVDIVANAYMLPFQDESVDLVITESLFEHLEFPEKAVAEMRRVLKPQGLIYVATPFMLGFHSSPNDFYRWTIPGMTRLLDGFAMQESGVLVGPSAAVGAILREWFAILLSFNSRVLFQLWTLFFMILFIPLNIFDFLISRYTMATQIPLAYYFLAKKQ